MSLSIDERISFIESLDIYNDPAIAAEATAASGSAAVNGSAAVYYAANVSAQMKARPGRSFSAFAVYIVHTDIPRFVYY